MKNGSGDKRSVNQSVPLKEKALAVNKIFY